MRQPTLSACLIVKNEAHVLGRCLSSLRGVADEVVVVDTGSTDHTATLAAAAGARVVREAWRDDFAAARNASIAAATGDWILAIDADEYLEADDKARLRNAVAAAGDGTDGVWVTVRNALPADDLLRWFDSRIVRLFRRHDDLRYVGVVHEDIETSIARRRGRVAPSSVVIQHDGYVRDTAQGAESRAARNVSLLVKAIGASPRDPYLHFQLGASYQHLGRASDARRHLQQVLQLGDDSLNDEVRAGAATRLAQLALAGKRHGSVVHYAGIALAIDPDHALAHLLCGLALMHLTQAGDALPHLLAAKQSGRMTHLAELDALVAGCAAQAPPPGAGA